MMGLDKWPPPENWLSDEDREGFHSDLFLHGKAYKVIRADGRTCWIPFLEMHDLESPK